MSMNKILVIDDEVNISEGIKESLVSEGYDVEIAYDGEEGLTKALDNKYDLILLDVMMPKLDGIEVCDRIRSSGSQVPVLFLTVKNSLDDRVSGLEAGGDDYLGKPFHLRELLLRISAILRRSEWLKDDNSFLNFGKNSINFKTYRAKSWEGVEHVLTHKEIMILKLFSENIDTVITREEILDKVWGYEVFPSTRTIDNFIVRLRKRFEINPESPEYFHTVRGVGYQFFVNPKEDNN